MVYNIEHDLSITKRFTYFAPIHVAQGAELTFCSFCALKLNIL